MARRDVPAGHKHYYFSDRLGSASVITSDLGVIQEESDYYPYGGETPIADSRKVFARIDTAIRDCFSQKNVRYVRNYGDARFSPRPAHNKIVRRFLYVASFDRFERQTDGSLETVFT